MTFIFEIHAPRSPVFMASADKVAICGVLFTVLLTSDSMNEIIEKTLIIKFGRIAANVVAVTHGEAHDENN